MHARTPRARINGMKKFYCFINARNVSSPFSLSREREARAPRSSSVPHDACYTRVITPMLATQRETLLRHVFVRPRQNEERHNGERDGARFPQATSRAWKFACKNRSYTHFVMMYCLTIHRFVRHRILRVSFT